MGGLPNAVDNECVYVCVSMCDCVLVCVVCLQRASPSWVWSVCGVQRDAQLQVEVPGDDPAATHRNQVRVFVCMRARTFGWVCMWVRVYGRSLITCWKIRECLLCHLKTLSETHTHTHTHLLPITHSPGHTR